MLSDLGVISCCNVLVFLKAIFMFVFLNRFVIFLIWGLKYVNVVVHVLLVLLSVCRWLFFCFVCKFIVCSRCYGKLLFLAVCCIVSHSFCLLVVVRGSECILVMWYLSTAGLCSVGWFERKLIKFIGVVC
jgi:hypothetical protein